MVGVSMGAAGFLIAAQQAGSLLDSEFEKLNPALSDTLAVVNSQLTQGFSPTQIALAAVGLPVAYQLIKILAGYSDTHRDGIQRRRDREDKEHAAKLERETELFKAQLQKGLVPMPPGSGGPTLSPPAQ